MVLVFDVNGTLLDTAALAPLFERMFAGRYAAREWFTEVVQHAMAVTLAGGFEEFGAIAIAVLEMDAAAEGVRLSPSDIRQVQDTMQSLPPFPEVPVALDRLRREGRRLAVLTNSGPSAITKQLANAGLDRAFERVITTSEARKHKPAPEVYRAAARALGVDPTEILMVAAHPWDLLGAARVGCRTALITRPGVASLPRLLAPEFVAADLAGLADQLAGVS